MASILCVDDEPSVLTLLQELLGPLGHDTVLVGSVDEAIGALRVHHIDLVLLDCVMPGRDGFAFLAHIHDHGLKIPAIMMTGYSSVENAVAAIRGGAAEYITKPLRAESVRLVISSVLQEHRPSGSISQEHTAPEDLIPPSPQVPPDVSDVARTGAVLNLRDLQQIAIHQALKVTRGHKTKAAELLGINERTLRNKLRSESDKEKGDAPNEE
jgi:DNA-binding NtrC family response regulator